MPNIIDVARAAGVSTATVSRAMNAPEKVSLATKKRVQEAIDRLNYNPGENRKSLIFNNTRTLLVVMPDFHNMYLIDVLSGINEAALRNGYSLLLFATNSILERETEAIKLLNKRQADGVIFLSSLLDDSKLKKIAEAFPLIQCCEYSETSGLPHVSIDNYTAYYEATEFLIKLGHRDIAMISANNSYISTTSREVAFRDAMAQHRLELRPEWLRHSPVSFIGGYENMQALLKQAHRPKAVLANDISATGAIRAIHEVGLRIPEDIAIMGIDNLQLCDMVTPALTTISQPRSRLGQTAVEMLLRQIMGETNQQSVFLPHALVVRKST